MDTILWIAQVLLAILFLVLLTRIYAQLTAPDDISVPRSGT